MPDVHTVLGWTLVAGALGWGAWLAVSPKARRRVVARGGEGRYVVQVLVAFTVLGVGTVFMGRHDARSGLFVLPGVALIIYLGNRQQRRLRTLPAGQLSPTMRTVLELPNTVELVRHPVASTRRLATVFR